MRELRAHLSADVVDSMCKVGCNSATGIGFACYKKYIPNDNNGSVLYVTIRFLLVINYS